MPFHEIKLILIGLQYSLPMIHGIGRYMIEYKFCLISLIIVRVGFTTN